MGKLIQKSIFLFLLIGVLFLSACATTSTTNKETSVSQGFTVMQGETSNKQATWHCIKIDLDTPGLEVMLVPESEGYKSAYISTTAKKHKAKVAITTTPFDMSNNDTLVGITKINGKEITPPVEHYAALCFTQNPLRAHIVNSQTAENLEKYPTAAGGFYTVLDKGTALSFQDIKRSRSAAGISEDGRFLYIFATTPKFNLRDLDGMTYSECAILLKELGCYSAMQFDGGHSTGLYFINKQLEIPFLQRKVPAVLIIK